MNEKTDEQYLLELREKYEELKKISILETKRADDWQEKSELLKRIMIYMTTFLTYDDRE